MLLFKKNSSSLRWSVFVGDVGSVVY